MLASALCGFTTLSAKKPVSTAEIMPKFRGEDAEKFASWVRGNCVYPTAAFDDNAEGKVDFSFVVGKDGKLSDIRIIESPHSSFIDEVAMVISNSPVWTPGKNGRKKVPVYLRMSIDFKIKKQEAPKEEGYSELPKFQGVEGLSAFRRWVANNITYPVEARRAGISGTVKVRFIIEKDGSLTNLIITQSPHPSLSNAVRTVLESSPKWTPANSNGEPVRLRYYMPVDFNLEGGVANRDPDPGLTPKPFVPKVPAYGKKR